MLDKQTYFAIIGADSKIGTALGRQLQEEALLFSRSARQAGSLYFDFDNHENIFSQDIPISRAIICAGITNLSYCENNPRETFRINCFLTSKLIDILNKQGIPVTVLSSSAVFGEYHLDPEEENLRYFPTCEYGLQKAFIDHYASISSDHNQIIRLTKVVSKDGIFKEFLDTVCNGGVMRPYYDLKFSPISLDYTIKSIIRILRSDLPGIFHLSGEKTMSYFDFVEELKLMPGLKFNKMLNIVPQKCPHKIYMPIKAGLSMSRTKREIGLDRQEFNELLHHLSKW